MLSQKMVHAFMRAMDLPLPHENKPGVEGLNFKLLRSLVQEEAEEFAFAMRLLEFKLEHQEDYMDAWAEVIDAICDIIVVVHNTSNAMGIDLQPFFDEVHRTNMMKSEGSVRADGKKLKPKEWKPPRIRELLLEQIAKKKTLFENDPSMKCAECFGNVETTDNECPHCGIVFSFEEN